MKWHSILPFAAIILCLFIGGWFVSYGDGTFLSDRYLNHAGFFDAQGDSLLHGKLDVPKEAINSEAFIVKGRFYGYFGITPSLFRLPLNALFPHYRDRWSSLSELVACSLFLFVAYSLVREVRKVIFPECPFDMTFNILCALFLIALGIGSTTIFLLSRPVVYHEVLLWSVALGLSSLFWAFKYWNEGGLGLLATANFFALMAIHTRPVAGCAALTACMVMPFLRYWPNLNNQNSTSSSATCRRREVIFGLLFMIMAFGSYLMVIYAKFHTLSGMPIQFHVQYNPQRLIHLKENMFHISNLVWNTQNYFGIYGWKLIFSDSIPQYLNQCILLSLTSQPSAIIDLVEPFMSIPVGLSSLLILSIFGIAGCIRKGEKSLGFTVIALVSLLGPILLMFFAAISYRYFHEWLLWMSCTGASAICVLRINAERNKILCLVLVVLLLINIAFNLLFSLSYQVYKTNVGPAIPMVREKIDRWDNFITRLGW